MRVLPEVQVTCHVCGSTFAVRNRMETRAGRVQVSSEPTRCPFCDAPIKSAPVLDVGVAKSLVLTDAGAPFEKKQYGTLERFLERHCRTEQDVDTLLALADGLDYAQWEHDSREQLARAPDAGLRAEARLVPRLRKAAGGGQLGERLRRAAGQVKDALRAERAHHLAIFEQRGGKR